jgi:hypothetical protein
MIHSQLALLALGVGRTLPPRKISWYSFLLEAELIAGPSEVGRIRLIEKKSVASFEIEHASFWLLA